MASLEDSIDLEEGMFNTENVVEEESAAEDLDFDADDVLMGWKRIFLLPFDPMWYYTMLVMAVFQIYLAIYEAGFRIYGREDGLKVDFTAVKYFSTVMYTVDILLTIGCKNLHGLRISPSEIRRPNWVLLADFTSILPLELLVPLNNITPFRAKLFYVMQLIDCLKIFRIYHLCNYAHNSVGSSKVYMQIFQYYFSMGLAIMVGFVITYQTICLEINCSETPTLEEYFDYLYISVSKITAKGFAEYPNNFFWKLSVTIIGFIVFVSVICGSTAYVAIAIYTALYHHYDFLNKLKYVNITFERYQVQKTIQKQVNEYFDAFWKYRTGYIDSSDCFALLTRSMFEEISLDISWYALRHSRLLRNMDIPFLRHISVCIQGKFLLPGEVVYSKNHTKDMMIYVVSGVIQLFSNEDDDTPILSFSAGTCLGEASLVLNYRPKAIVRCKTFCMLHILQAKDFVKLMKLFPNQFLKLRKEFKKRLIRSEKEHNLFVSLKSDQLTTERTDYLTIMWLKATLHRLMIDDADISRAHECQNIFLREEFDKENFINMNFTATYLDMLVISERLELITDTVFLKTSCPCVFQPASIILKSWDTLIVILAVINVFIVPYFVLVDPNIPFWYELWVYTITVLWLLDLYIQISTAIKLSEKIIADVVRIFLARMAMPMFLLDLFASIPLEVLSSIIVRKVSPQYQALLRLNRILKVWRIVAIFRNWQQQLNANLIFNRYVKYCCILCFTIYIFSCLMFSINCFDFECIYVSSDSIPIQLLWCAELVTHILTGVSVGSRLYNKAMYYPFCLLLTVISTAFFVYMYGSLAAEYALQRVTRSKLSGTLSDVVEMMASKHLSSEYNGRVFAYVETQWLENGAAKLMYKASPFVHLPTHTYNLFKETSYKEALVSIPLFQELPDKIMLEICKAVRNIVYPPNEVICYAGDLCNTFHIIANGHCKLVSDSIEMDQSILEPGDSIATLETCLRIPAVYTAVTVTHCRLVVVDWVDINRVYLKFPDYKEEVDNALQRGPLISKLEQLSDSNHLDSKYVVVTERRRRRSFRNFGYNIETDTLEEYDYYIPFDRLGIFSFVQYFLLRFTIFPDSKFLYRWEILRCLFAILSAILFSFVGISTCTNCDWYFLLAFLDGTAWIDMYVRFHVCYYNEEGLLVTHPLSTATYYLTHGFLVDFIGVFPIHLFFRVHLRYYNLYLYALQLNRLLQMHRYFGFFKYIQDRTFLLTRVMAITKYFPVVLILCICSGSFLINMICTFNEEIPGGDLFSKGVTCMDNTWISKSLFLKPISPGRVEAYGVYFIASMLTLSGMSGFKIRSTIIAIFGIPLGFIAYILNLHIVSMAIAEYTGGFSTLLEYQQSMNVVRNFMERFKVSADLQKKLIAYFELNWNQNRGREIHQFIKKFHRPLQEDILYDIYGKTLEEASLFVGDSKAFVRNLLLEVIHEVSAKNSFILCINDITKYLHILYKGNVTVLAPDGSKLATLTPGSMFGNLDDYDMTRQTVTIVALDHVEILTIESLRYHAIISNYPKIYRQYRRLIALHVDYIKSHRKGKTHSVYSIGASTSSMSKNPFTIISNAVFHPRSLFIRIWQLIIQIGVCYGEVCFGVYQAAMAEYGLGVIVFQYTCDLLYLIDYYVMTHTAYEDEIGAMVTDLKMIKKRLFPKRVTYWCSIFCMIPFDVFAWLFPRHIFRYLYPALRANRLLRFFYFIYHFKEQKRKLSINLHVVRFTYLISWSTFILHCITCFFIALSCTHAPSMYPQIDCDETSSYKKLLVYITYFYTTVSCFICASQGSSYPESVTLIIFCIFFMIFLQLLNAAFLAEIYSTIRKGYHKQNKYAQYLERVKNFMEREQLSDSLYRKAFDYLGFLWRKQRGASFPRLLLDAPSRLREPVLNSAFAHHLNDHFIFKKCHVDFNRQVVACLRTLTFFRDDYIVFEGTIDKSMYFIESGEVVVLTEDGSFKETVAEVLKPGKSFGVTQGLFPNKPHSFTFRANKTTTILCLQLEMWKHLFRFFPASKEMIKKRYEQFGDKYA